MTNQKFPLAPIYSEGFNGKFPLFEIGYDPFKWAHPPTTPRKRVVENPVPIGFLPWAAAKVDDSREHEGVSFAELWSDPVARTLWLAHKRFMITSQYFRLRCIQHANELRRRPGSLLQERIWFNVGDGGWFPEEWLFEIGSQIGPYLIWALQRDGKWPYLRVPCKELGWRYVKR